MYFVNTKDQLESSLNPFNRSVDNFLEKYTNIKFWHKDKRKSRFSFLEGNRNLTLDNVTSTNSSWSLTQFSRQLLMTGFYSLERRARSRSVVEVVIF